VQQRLAYITMNAPRTVINRSDCARIDPAIGRTLISVPIIDAALTVVNFGYDRPLVGALSLAQLVHGLLLLWFALLLLRLRLGRVFALNTEVAVGTLALVAALAFTSVLELLREGAISLRNLVAYLQIIYWIWLWWLALKASADREWCKKILQSVVVSMIVAAGSVFYGAFGGTAVSSFYGDNIRGSFGWYSTGKTLAGELVVGAYVVYFLFHGRYRILAPVASAFMLTACFLTYARAGAFAAVVSLAWYFGAGIARTRRRQRASIVLFLLILIAGSVVWYVQLGTGDWEKRLSDLHDMNKAGSGRATFWPIAWNLWRSADHTQQAFGIGYEGVLQLMAREYGAPIHTHSDVLDLLLVCGACGVVALGFIVYGMFRLAWRARATPQCHIPAVAVVLVFVIQGSLTGGQVFGPNAMALFLLPLCGLVGMSRQDGALRPGLKVPARRRQ
jgi:hypothetical protein